VFSNPKLRNLAPVILYRILGPTLPEGLAAAAVLWGASAQVAMQSGASIGRAGFDGPPQEAAQKLFDAMLANPSGIVFAIDEWSACFDRVGTIHLDLPDLLVELAALKDAPLAVDPAYPFVLSAGERRSFTANTIIRDPEWRKKDSGGALRISPADAANLGVSSGDSVRLTTARDTIVVSVEVTDMMQSGHISLPNGLGLDYPDGDDNRVRGGIAPNELTASEDRDPFAGTPWHKHVPARLERV
jgi:anaerobic selenocysteine-containing dehydrogenase